MPPMVKSHVLEGADSSRERIAGISDSVNSLKISFGAYETLHSVALFSQPEVAGIISV